MISKWIRRDVWNLFIETLKKTFGSNYGITNQHIERALYFYSKNLEKKKFLEIGITEQLHKRPPYKLKEIIVTQPDKQTPFFGKDDINDGGHDNNKQ
jgi:hypothetical protein